jgi:hypothetical protein
MTKCIMVRIYILLILNSFSLAGEGVTVESKVADVRISAVILLLFSYFWVRPNPTNEQRLRTVLRLCSVGYLSKGYS